MNESNVHANHSVCFYTFSNSTFGAKAPCIELKYTAGWFVCLFVDREPHHHYLFLDSEFPPWTRTIWLQGIDGLGAGGKYRGWSLMRRNSILRLNPGNTLQQTAIHCTTLHHTATHCNTLQHTAIQLDTAAQTPADQQVGLAKSSI